MIARRRFPVRLGLAVLALSIVSASHLDELPGSTGADRLPDSVVARIDARVAATLADRKIPGLSVAVYDGRTLWSKGYGIADVENAVPATEDTVYRLASVSKPITAAAAMKLVEEGRFDLDAPVQNYVPTFRETKWPVTGRELLSHLGGIRGYRGDENASTRHYHNRTAPLAIFGNDPLVHEPGTKYLYSSYGYNLLGAAVEGAAGRPFLEVLKTSVFDAAGMNTIRDDDPDAIIPHRAQGYRLVHGRLQNSILADISNKVPSGGLCSDASDVARFAVALLEGRILKPATLQEMWTSSKTKDGAPVGYGMGWSVGRFNGVREISHNGAQPKVSTLLYIRPDKKIVVVILANLEGVSLVELARELADAAQGN